MLEIFLLTTLQQWIGRDENQTNKFAQYPFLGSLTSDVRFIISSLPVTHADLCQIQVLL